MTLTFGQDFFSTGEEDDKAISKVKPSYTSITNDTSLNDDPHLQAHIDGNSTYDFEMYLAIDVGSTTPDIEVFVNVPAGCNGLMNVAFIGASNASGNIIFDDFFTNYIGLACSDSIINKLYASGKLVTSTGGTLVVRWAQNTSSASYTKVMTDSFITLTKR